MTSVQTVTVSSTTTVGVLDSSDSNAIAEINFAEQNVGIIPRHLYLAVIYIILIFGLLGNILIFVLMHQPSSCRSSYSMYLRCLAVLDSGVLLTICLEDILDHQFHILHQFLGSSLFLCKTWNYVAIFTRFISPWFVVALTWDRFVTIGFPQMQGRFCSFKAASFLSIGLVIAVFFEAMYAFVYFVGVLQENGVTVCEISGPSSLAIYRYIEGLLLQSTLPCFIILFLNVYTIVVIKRINIFRDAVGTTDKERRHWKIIKVSISLIAVSLMTFCTLTPKAALEVAEYFWERRYDKAVEARLSSNSTEPLEKPGYLTLANNVWPLLNLIALINFGQNFYVMMITGPKYREALRALCGRRRDTDTEMEHSGTALVAHEALVSRQDGNFEL